MDSMWRFFRTSIVPKFVLRYELDKGSTSVWKVPLTNLVPQIKRLMVDECKSVCFLSVLLFSSVKLEKLVTYMDWIGWLMDGCVEKNLLNFEQIRKPVF